MFEGYRDEHSRNEHSKELPQILLIFGKECCADGHVRFHSQTPRAEVEMGMISIPSRKIYQ